MTEIILVGCYNQILPLEKFNNINAKFYFVDPEYFNTEQIEISNGEYVPLYFHKWKHEYNSSTRYIFVSFIENINTTYKFMNFLEMYETENFHYLIFESFAKLFDVLPYPPKVYNIYLGDAIDKTQITNSDFLEIKKLYQEGLIFLFHYFDANIHKSSTSNPEEIIPSWCFNPELPIVKGLIVYFDLINHQNEIHSPKNEMCYNAYYRRLIMESLCKIIANFAVNNNLITVDEVRKWMKKKTFELINSRLENFFF